VTKREEFVFKINAFTPETIPMARLAEYMADLARLLSETASVHFVRLDGGSTALVHAVDYEAVPKVEARISAAKSVDAPAELLKISEDINRKLREDNADGEIFRAGGGQIIQFPGINTPKQITFGPVTQFGSIDGIVRRIGGKGNQIPVMLETDLKRIVLRQERWERRLPIFLTVRLSGVPVGAHGKGISSGDGCWTGL
jgi:hypothetical protein